MEWTMRRKKQQLTEAEALQMLDEATSGVLSLVDPDGKPYGVPISFARDNKNLYFHSALQGRKLEAVRHCPWASFCVIAQDEIIPERFTTEFRSVIASGPIEEITEDQAKRQALELLAEKYSAEVPSAMKDKEIDGGLKRCAILKLEMQELSGKEAIELVRRRQEQKTAD